MAPEVLLGKQKIDETSDVYSYAVLIWELLSGKVPFADLDYDTLVHTVV